MGGIRIFPGEWGSFIKGYERVDFWRMGGGAVDF